jgi:hypothetical protein
MRKLMMLVAVALAGCGGSEVGGVGALCRCGNALNGCVPEVKSCAAGLVCDGNPDAAGHCALKP